MLPNYQVNSGPACLAQLRSFRFSAQDPARQFGVDGKSQVAACWPEPTVIYLKQRGRSDRLADRPDFELLRAGQRIVSLLNVPKARMIWTLCRDGSSTISGTIWALFRDIRALPRFYQPTKVFVLPVLLQSPVPEIVSDPPLHKCPKYIPIKKT